MSVLGGLLGGAGRGVTANGGISNAIFSQQESNRQAKSAKIKDKLNNTQRLATLIADPNQSDETIVNAVNKFNEINDIPVRVSTIEEALPQRAEAKKISNMLLKAKGNFTPELLRNTQSLLTQFENKFGENELLRGQLEAGRASQKKEQDRIIDFQARVIANSLGGGKNSTQQVAEFARNNANLFAGGSQEASNRINARVNELMSQNQQSNLTQSKIDKNRGVNSGVQVGAKTEAQQLLNTARENVGAGATQQEVLNEFNRLSNQQPKTLPPTGQTGEQLIADVRKRNKDRRLLTTEQAQLGTGAIAAARSAINFVAGALTIAGVEVAPKTAAAKTAIKSFNQFVKAGLTITDRNAISELKTIDKFLLKTDLSDPSENITNLLGLVNRLENAVISGQDQLNNSQMSVTQREHVTNAINKSLSLLGQLPSTAEIKLKTNRVLNKTDVSTMTKNDIREIDLNDVNREEKVLLRNRLVELENL